MNRTVIVEGFRTGFCKQGTFLRDVPADILGAMVVKEMIARLNMWGLKSSIIDYVVGSNVTTPPHAPTIARVAAIKGGLPKSIPAQNITQNCGSGISAVDYGSNLIKIGRHETVLIVGVESMSQVPLFYADSIKRDLEAFAYAKNWQEKTKIFARFLPKQIKVWQKEYQPKAGLLLGFTDPICGLIMGLTAENLAKDPSLEITRKKQDDFALFSHQKAKQAQKLLAEEICPLCFPNGSKYSCVASDNGIRKDPQPEAFAKTKPFFDKRYGTVTAGNSSQITDGAACILLMKEEKAKALGLPILGYIVNYTDIGFDPEIMGLSPVGAIAKILKQSEMSLKDFSVVEINEAFAAQTLACLKTMSSHFLMKKYFYQDYGFDTALGEIDSQNFNPNGGAIALGHPIGVSGMRLIITALKELARRNGDRALVSACIGGGQGNAMIVERSR